LAANTLYEICVFAGDLNPSPGSNRVTVTAGSSSLTFEQPHDSNQLVVNASATDHLDGTQAIDVSDDDGGVVRHSVVSKSDPVPANQLTG